LEILLIEPFYTGSHKYWADNLLKHSKHYITLLTLPGKHWKWRMHGAAITLAEKVNNRSSDFDLILISDMMDAAVFKSLLHKPKPIILYFHENQLTYPWSETDPDPELKRDHHYGWINYISCLAADRIIFNSDYNRRGFILAIEALIQRMPDYHNFEKEDLLSRSIVLPIGIDFPQKVNRVKQKPPILLWNHRWEFDKNPELFFNTLFRLHNEGIDFQLIVCGEQYAIEPLIFKVAKDLLHEKIIHFGYAKNKSEYHDLLSQTDIYPVTSNQDFFGLSVLEAIAFGAEPLLPNRLAYPEHLDTPELKVFYYKNDADFYDILKKFIQKDEKDVRPTEHVRKKYPWSHISALYDQFFEEFHTSK
jgi:glycosyltransferase involved in cell wall biosynthesis